MISARQNFKRRRLLGNFAFHGSASILSLLFLSPFLVTFLGSFRNGQEASSPPIPPWPTTGFSLDAYRSLDTFGAASGSTP